MEARHAAILGVLAEKPAEGGVHMAARDSAGRDEVLQAAAPFIVSAVTR